MTKDIEVCSNLQDLKSEYVKFKEKYALPEFDDLNRVFDIEELDIETDFLLRRIRRIITDRIASYLRFVEAILNPSNAPMFFFKVIKKLENSDKESLTRLQGILGKIEINVVALDLDYHEEMEAKFIVRISKCFEEDIKATLLDIVYKMGNGENQRTEEKTSYFG
ncbi:hypothetical protein GOV14_06155 [Candidatus Pacearchaeota archaeon]|nr:hypothetical protein [Candidatus Pacearchaeota archaeon]